MADNQLRRIDVDFGDDDPFAELKQIMGIEQPTAAEKPVEAPKAEEPARPAAPASEPVAYAEPAAESDDFSIDLEEELLAGFRSEFDAPAAKGQDTAPAAATIDLDAWVSNNFEPQAKIAPVASVAFEPVAVKPTVVEPARAVAAEPVEFDAAGPEPVVDELAAEDFDEAFAIALDDDFAPEAQPAAPQAAARPAFEPALPNFDPFADFETKQVEDDGFDDDFAAALDDDLMAEAAAEPVPAAPPAATGPVATAAASPAPGYEAAPVTAHYSPPQAAPAPVESAPDFDIEPDLDPVELAFDHDELMRDLDDVLAALPDSEPVVAEPAPIARIAADPVQRAIDLDFDVAMAEVDMEFGDEQPEASVPDFELDDFAIEYPLPQEQHAEYQPEAAASDDQRYSAYEDDAYTAEDDAYKAPVASTFAVPAYEAAPVARQELTFEEELQALLRRPVEPAVLAHAYDSRPLSVSSLTEPAPQAYDEAPDWGLAELAKPNAYDARSERSAVADAKSSQIDAEFESVLNAMTDAAAHRPVTPEPRNDAAAQYEDEVTAFDDDAFDTAFENALADADDGAHDFERAAQTAPIRPVSSLQREISAYYDRGNDTARAGSRSNGNYAAAPQVETIDVPETGVAVTDELDIPEFVREDDVRPVAAYDDFEPDFSEIFNEPAEAVRASAAAPKGAGQQMRDEIADYEAALATTAAATAAINGARQPAEWEPDYEPQTEDAYLADGRPAMEQAPQFDDFDDQFDGSADYADAEIYAAEPAPSRRGYVIAAVVGGVALLGAAGAFALSFNGDSATSGPAIVRAGDEPIKIRPENPGGTTVPNADSKVFETMNGAAGAKPPAQEKLNPSSEEPVDLAARNIEMTPVDDVGDEATDPETVAVTPAEPSGKSEDRVAPDQADGKTADSMEVAAVQPRRVKTMVVRSDGTLVPREEPIEPAPPASKTVQPSALQPAVPAAENPPAAEDSAPEATALAPAVPAAKPAAKPAETVAEKPARVAKSETPNVGPLAAARPSDQPVDIVGEVAPERVATVAPAGGWSVQIASQPSEEAAHSTYTDLARKYASVIGGKQASVVKAEIQGKGTFWRVRIAANSRNDAINLCETYKSAGGSCFVSK